MFQKVSTANLGFLPLLFCVFALSSCGAKTSAPTASASINSSTSASSSSPLASTSVSPSAMSSSMSSPAVSPKADVAVGMKPVAGECPKSEQIKGKISKRGKIYHVPDSQGYAEVKPSTCFATVAEAETAGFRAPHKRSEHSSEK